MLCTNLMHASSLHLQPDSTCHQPFIQSSGYISNDEDDDVKQLSDEQLFVTVPRHSSHNVIEQVSSTVPPRYSSFNYSIKSRSGLRIPLKSFNEHMACGNKFISLDAVVKHQVYVCVVFLKIGEIDTIKEQYAADVLIKSKWREPDLDNKTEQLIWIIIYYLEWLLPVVLFMFWIIVCRRFSVDVPDYDWTNSWSPKLYIENTIGEAKEHIYHMITFNEFNHAFLCEKRRVSGIFLENLELNHFPFDVQDLTITVASNLPTSEIRLVNDPDESHRINKQSFVDEQEWYLYKHIETEQKELAYEYTDPATVRPALSVKCRAARRPAYFIWNIFLVTFLICSLSLVTFAVDKSLPQNRLQLTYTLVLTLVAFKFVVNQCLPKISYLTYLDKYVISSLFILTLICLWHGLIVVIEKISDRFKYKLPDDMEMYVIIVMALGYVGYNLAFIVMIYCVACQRRRDMKQKDREYVEKVQCQMKYKGMRAMKMVQQTHQLHEVKENGNATFI